jgi:RNA ligase (TIGR02306 family)
LQDKVVQGENIEHEFLTAALGVTYAVAEDNQRKAAPADKYKKMAQRHPKIFKKSWAKWLMKRSWGKKLMFLFFGKRKDKKNPWPGWVKKTDEERIQNLPHILSSKDKWIVTEKIDGSSTTATYKKTGKKKHEYYICSRNVVFDKPDKGCYYEFNPYTEMSEKYHFEEVLGDLVKKYDLEWATLQGEVYGAGIQKRDYSLEGHEFAGFNLIFSDRGRLNSVESAEIMSAYGIPWVPILHDHFKLLPTVDEMLDFATGKSTIDGGMREGLIFRSQDGTQSFKAVSNQFLLKYHQ